jgi:hypothetical protein
MEDAGGDEQARANPNAINGAKATMALALITLIEC